MSDFTNVHALIIEDDPMSIDVLRGLFEQLGVQYTVLKHHDEAGILNAPSANVVFLDLEMPGLNGYDVLGLLRSTGNFDDVPIVAYTTHVSHMNDAQTAGFDCFMAKPLDRHLFADNLMRILNGESIWEA